MERAGQEEEELVGHPMLHFLPAWTGTPSASLRPHRPPLAALGTRALMLLALALLPLFTFGAFALMLLGLIGLMLWLNLISGWVANAIATGFRSNAAFVGATS